MANVTIRIPTPLRSFTGGADEIQVQGSTIEQALTALGEQHAGILDYVLDEAGGVRRFVNVYLGDRNIATLDGLGTSFEDSAVLSIVPAVAGGAG